MSRGIKASLIGHFKPLQMYVEYIDGDITDVVEVTIQVDSKLKLIKVCCNIIGYKVLINTFRSVIVLCTDACVIIDVNNNGDVEIKTITLAELGDYIISLQGAYSVRLVSHIFNIKTFDVLIKHSYLRKSDKLKARLKVSYKDDNCYQYQYLLSCIKSKYRVHENNTMYDNGWNSCYIDISNLEQ